MQSTRITCSLQSMNMTIGQRIAEARTKASLNQSQLAARLSVAPQSVQQWEQDKTTPRRERVERLAALLNVSPEWILFGRDPAHPLGVQDTPSPYQVNNPDTETVTSATDSVMVSLPLLESAALAAGAEHDMEETEKHVLVGKTLTAQFNVDETETFALHAQSDEMSPRIRPGDYLLINHTKRQPNEAGVYLIRINGELLLRRLTSQLSGHWKLSCDNPHTPGYKEEILSAQQLKQLDIVGRVVMVMGAI